VLLVRIFHLTTNIY